MYVFLCILGRIQVIHGKKNMKKVALGIHSNYGETVLLHGPGVGFR